MSEATRTAVIVTVSSAEVVVGQHRERFDPSASWGVPAHVTASFPFVAPGDVDTHVTESLAAAVASVPRFRAEFATTGWFGTDVLWLDPQPGDRFRALTAAIANAFPEYPPYGGAYADVVPHLTIGAGASPSRLREAERQVLARLPIRTDVAVAELWGGSDAAGSWERVATFPLGSGEAATV